MEKQTEYIAPPRVGIPLVALVMGVVLVGSKNVGVKALGAGVVTASFLNLINKLSSMVD